ncbi:MAG: hypothetical protein H0U23_05710 [Blastocatellia bacterium]|nr:hypothetical protein [Blastocatellia bacterium]
MKTKMFLLLACVSFVTCLSALAVDRINITEPPYNAIPNDGIPDTAAINAAVAAGTSIYFPPGTYNFTGRITLPNKAYRLYGDGPGVSTILFTGPTAGIYSSNLGANTLNVEGLTLEAITAAAGTAISATFSPGANAKFHTATIHNVEIRGSDRTISASGYWTRGIYLFQAPNSFIDKIAITGNSGSTTTGIQWSSAVGSATTGLFITNAEIQWCNSAISTAGWVEGFYMSGFEVVLCGTPAGTPALNFLSTAPSQSPAFTLINGHVDMLGDGVKMQNLSAIKVSHVDFEHVNGTADGTYLSLTACIGAIITDCTFTSASNVFNNENGVFLTSTDQARVSGNIFRGLDPKAGGTGSPIVAYTGSKTVRISGNIFKSCQNSFDNYIGSQAYYDTDNVIVP